MISVSRSGFARPTINHVIVMNYVKPNNQAKINKIGSKHE